LLAAIGLIFLAWTVAKTRELKLMLRSGASDSRRNQAGSGGAALKMRVEAWELG
jgi:hypothetical protein